jgi:hypothetical protein
LSAYLQGSSTGGKIFYFAKQTVEHTQNEKKTTKNVEKEQRTHLYTQSRKKTLFVKSFLKEITICFMEKLI